MADTLIEWATKVWNPVRGCERVSAGCQNCYAEKQAHRFSGQGGAYEGLTKLTKSGVRWTGKIMLVEKALEIPLSWKEPEKIFVNSMSDLLHKDIPDEFLFRIFKVMSRADRHVYQVLTKRLDEYSLARLNTIINSVVDFNNKYCYWSKFPKNLWFGVSVENQATADERLYWLKGVRAGVRFISCEPLLEPINLKLDSFSQTTIFGRENFINWVIAGAESGKGKGVRPMHESWVRDIKNQCVSAGVDFFYKQAMDEKKNKISLPILDGQRWVQSPRMEGR